MDFSTEQAREVLNKGIEEAESVISSPSKVDEILMQLEEKLKAVPVIGSTLSDLPLMISMIKAWIKKEYTVVSPKVIACLVGAVIYLIKKKDLISDSIPIVGLLDDISVVTLVMSICEPELKAYAAWRAEHQGADPIDISSDAEVTS